MSHYVSTHFVSFSFTFITIRVRIVLKVVTIVGNFQNVLKSLRKSEGLTQTDLASALNISRSAIGMYESGAREPDFETLEMIADYFNVDVDYLMGRTNKTTKLINPNADSHYYLNEETRAIAQDIYENPDLRILFDASKNTTPEDLKFIIEMVKRMKGEN